jgi:C-terminal processing protease CtpA/Prc
MRNLNRWIVVLAAATLLPAQLLAQRTSANRAGWLGVGYNVMVTMRDGRSNVSVTVNEVAGGSPADRAGIKRGDRIVRIDGRAVTADRFEDISRALEVGDTLHLTIASADREREVTLVAAARPLEYTMVTPRSRQTIVLSPDSIHRMARIFIDSARFHMDSLFGDSVFIRKFSGFRFAPFDTLAGSVFRFRTPFDSVGGGMFRIFGDTFPGRLDFRFGRSGEFFELPNIEMMGQRSVAGAEFQEMNPGLAQYFNVSDGLLVLRVSPGTPAARAGLEAGDVLTRVDGRAVSEVADLRSALGGNGEAPLKLEIIRKNAPRTLQLERGRVRRD